MLPGRPSVRSVNRWCIEGVAGERLAHTRIGCKIITTRSALTEFARRVSERYHDPRPPRDRAMTTRTHPARPSRPCAAPARPNPLFAGLFGDRPCPNDLAETVGDFAGLRQYAASIAPAPSQRSLDETPPGVPATHRDRPPLRPLRCVNFTTNPRHIDPPAPRGPAHAPARHRHPRPAPKPAPTSPRA